VSAKGTLPAMKDGEITIIGFEEICSHLEKYSKIAKLSYKKKKTYHFALNHSQRMESLLENRVLKDGKCIRFFLLSEMDFLEENIKGPFFLGSFVSWVSFSFLSLIFSLFFL
jgi:hypothetical protein